MAEGSVFKRCSCRDANGRRLGSRCPQLRRGRGAWNPGHGRWGYQLELPPRADGSRRQLRRTGFDSRDAATDERSQAKALLDLAGDDPTLAAEIADLLAAVKPGAPLPNRDTIARRVRAGLPATITMTVAEYLHQWLASRRRIEPTTVRAYQSHIRVHLIPHLGHIPLEKLRVAHIEAMFTAIADRTTAIQITRQSDDPQIRATVTGARTTGPATMHRIRATLRKALNDAWSSSTRPRMSNCPPVPGPRRGSGPPTPCTVGGKPGSAPARSWCGPRSRRDGSSTTPKTTTLSSTRCSCSSSTVDYAAAKRSACPTTPSTSTTPSWPSPGS
jgi:hypothetical protein